MSYIRQQIVLNKINDLGAHFLNVKLLSFRWEEMARRSINRYHDTKSSFLHVKVGGPWQAHAHEFIRFSVRRQFSAGASRQ
jgi:hypothetical protein